MLLNRSPRRRLVLCGVVLMLLAAACDGDDTVTPPDVSVTPPSEETTPPTTTSPPAPTSVAETTTPSTTAPPTTVATTPPTPTTSPPTTSDTDLSPEERAIVDAAIRTWQIFDAIKLDPLDDAKLQAVRDTHRDDALQSALRIIEDFRIQNWRGIENPVSPSAIEPFPATIEIDGNVASIESCQVNSNVIVEVGGNADGTDLVIDDSILVARIKESFVRSGDEWLITSGGQLEVYEEAQSCDDIR